MTPRRAILTSSINGGNSMWEKGEIVVATFHSYGCYEIRKFREKVVTDLVPVDLLTFGSRAFRKEKK